MRTPRKANHPKPHSPTLPLHLAQKRDRTHSPTTHPHSSNPPPSFLSSPPPPRHPPHPPEIPNRVPHPSICATKPSKYVLMPVSWGRRQNSQRGRRRSGTVAVTAAETDCISLPETSTCEQKSEYKEKLRYAENGMTILSWSWLNRCLDAAATG